VTILCWLDRISASDRPLVGEKAFIASQLHRRGYPITKGFVILNTVFAEFLETINASDSILADFPQSSLYLDVDDAKALQLVAQESRRAILKAAIPASWQEELENAVAQLSADTLIWRFSLPENLARRSLCLFSAPISGISPYKLENAIKKAWSELFTARSLFYWRRMGIGLEKIQLSLLVQPLLNANCAGNVLINPDRWQIQATWGLGQSLTNGEVAPDIYIIDRSGQLLSRQLGHKFHAYHLNPDNHLVSAQLLSQELQESYCLDNLAIDRLCQLIQSLLAEKPTLTSIEWIMTGDSQLYLINCHSQEINPITRHYPLRGLAASPGVVSGVAKIITNFDSAAEIFRDSILVTSNLPPQKLPHLRQIKAMITEQGGLTSHGAILARELGIPAIVGVTDATEIIQSGEIILVDGTRGIISQALTETISLAAEQPQSNSTEAIATRLMVNISQTESIVRIQNLPIDGIGLLRSEWMILELLSQRSLETWLTPKHQEEFIERLSNLIEQFATSVAPRPLFYRSFDGKQPLNSPDSRGTHGYLLDPTLFDLELQALRRVQTTTATNINLLLPFVRGIEEFIFCRQRVQSALLTQVPSFQLGIMVEVPGVIFQLADYIQAGVQAIAIGTNDLTQLLLGSDREHFSEYFNAGHPAVREALKQIITQAKLLQIPCSVCGMAIVQYPDIIDDLIAWGVTSLSVDSEAILATREAIIRAERRFLLENTREGYK
jgi:pyruvate, water dikinase